MNSPPKRMTRARTAAKAGEPAVKTTRIVTAAAKARTTTTTTTTTAVSSTLTASTKSTAAKRKTRADDNDDEEERLHTLARRPRGRPKKAPETEEEQQPVVAPKPAPAPARATRARAAATAATTTTTTTTTTTRKVSTGVVREEPVPAKPTRGRPRKTAPQPDNEEKKFEEDAPEPTKKTTTTTTNATTTRTRAATTGAAKPSTATSTAAKPAVKKIVKFQEPDKENVEPATRPKEPPTAGLRGRPARRGGATAARTTRTAAKPSTSETSEKKPLSPKKVTQLPAPRDESEDELAVERVPVKPMMMSPIKPPTGTKKAESMPVEDEAEPTITVNTAVFSPPEMDTATLASPARRPPSPHRDTLKSPAKRIGAVPLPGSAFKFTGNDETGQTPFKPSLLQSAAKRPQSPIKSLGLVSAQKLQTAESASKPSLFQSPAKRAIPGFKPLLESRLQEVSALDESPKMKSLVVSTPTPAVSARPSEKLMMEDDMLENAEDEPFKGPIEGPQFSGRMPAVLPRHADPSPKEMAVVEEEEVVLVVVEEEKEEEEPLQLVGDDADAEATEEEPMVEDDEVEAEEEEEANDEETPAPVETADEDEDPMALDEIVAEVDESTDLPAKTADEPENPVFQLRDKDLDPCHDLNSVSDSEDDTLPIGGITAALTIQKTPKSRLSVSKKSRRSTIGFTALSEQLGSWSATSPVKSSSANVAQEAQPTTPVDISNTTNEDSPMGNTFFEDEVEIHTEPAAVARPLAEVQEPVFEDDAMITDEDAALAQEANEMSLLENEGPASPRQSFDDSLSDTSQEYGDENQVPIDPAILGPERHAPITPVRPVMKSFHTTTKVPLKPSDDSSPTPLKKRYFSASRVGPKRPSRVTRSASVISYLPTKEHGSESESDAAPVTPGKTEGWSIAGTPARTPRRNLDPSLLRGAIVFVDVHTSEGADASGIFVELLTQMGARCVKSWSWNPSSPPNGESCKVGITHVVFKDGGKRTLEKVRQANGVVQCVGVSWVLDCERENRWLDELPYCIDTSCVPRGGARRRKSMEPKALANMNGTLVSGSAKDRRESTPAPRTPNRRQSSVWMHTPSDAGGEQEDDEEDMEWSKLILTPVPKTPAPEAIARFAAETPSDLDEEDDEDDDEAADGMALSHEEMLMRTCPPKAQKFAELGAGILSRDKDENVLVRLMAARRKSLQFAPKVGSPLAKMWR